ncbi:hypothetical protein SAMN05421812_12417 [Asanoa hainanensis]|uniref:SnoaL-like domain-containing protein n=1 Tax=Asanoa hainanensis TaxID=560556 RepID=A0A239PFZ9_9ACTN|nr:hypothetical protein [Asanoa hainanensis]SNT65568.1 hypothetical protein SAMN05421812_12417 [Asanoa hainanensis]
MDAAETDRDRVADWLEAYERVWRTPGTEALAEIFTEDARYSQGPYEEPVLGLAAIGRMWERAREGADEPFTMRARSSRSMATPRSSASRSAMPSRTRTNTVTCGSCDSEPTANVGNTRNGRSPQRTRRLCPNKTV